MATPAQTEDLLLAPSPTSMKGIRNRALLAVLIGCRAPPQGDRRPHRRTLALRDARWVILDLIGKGGRTRTVPMPSWAKAATETWTGAAAITTGLIFRSINKGGISPGPA